MGIENVILASKRVWGEELVRIAEKNGIKESTRLSGSQADVGEFDDNGEETHLIMRGAHRGHVVTLYTEKHNCGAYGESERCSCGASFKSAMNGCWQQGHQREQEGESILAMA